MSGRWICGLVVLATAMGVATADDPGRVGFQRFSGGPPLSPIPPAPPEKPKAKGPDPDQQANETAAAMRAQEEMNLLRRLAVCDRIKQVALETGNSQLESQAIRLEERATEVYKQRMARLPAPKPKAPKGDQS
jgi:hypothetical protein